MGSEAEEPVSMMTESTETLSSLRSSTLSPLGGEKLDELLLEDSTKDQIPDGAGLGGRGGAGSMAVHCFSILSHWSSLLISEC